MNKNTKRNKVADRKAGKHFHGKACNTAFGVSPESKRKSKWRGSRPRREED